MINWYDSIIEKIKSENEITLFVIDSYKLLENKELLKIVENDFEIYKYSGEIHLRLKIKKRTKKIIVIVESKEVLPYDLEKKYGSIELSLKEIFFNIEDDLLNKINIEKIAKVYEQYINSGYYYTTKNIDDLKKIIEFSNENEIKEEAFYIKNTINNIEEELLKENVNYPKISKLIGELLFDSKGKENFISQFLDDSFIKFIKESFNKYAYNKDFSTSPLNSNIIKDIYKTEGKKALICFDCMSFCEWNILKQYLKNNSKYQLVFEEKYSFSLIPSITKYSRMSIFENQLPINSKFQTEEKAFQNYLKSNFKLENEYIFFNREKIPQNKNFLGYSAVGLIYNFIDDFVHSALNKEMLINNIEIYLKESVLAAVIDELLSDNFDIYLCSDHGNVFCEPNGINESKYLVEEKATRSLLYKHKNIAEELKFEGKEIFEFPQMIDGIIVTNNNRKKFGRKESGITHGGVTVEEVIIPFVRVSRI